MPHADLAPLGHRSAGSRGQLWRPQTSACTTQGPAGTDGPCHGTAGAQRSRVCTCTHTVHTRTAAGGSASRCAASALVGCLLASRAHRPDRHRMRQIYQNPCLDSPLTGGALEDRRLRCAPFAACILLPRSQEESSRGYPSAGRLRPPLRRHTAPTQGTRNPPARTCTEHSGSSPAPAVAGPRLHSSCLVSRPSPHLPLLACVCIAAVLIARHYASF